MTICGRRSDQLALGTPLEPRARIIYWVKLELWLLLLVLIIIALLARTSAPALVAAQGRGWRIVGQRWLNDITARNLTDGGE